MLETLGLIVVALLCLSFLVTIHEFGHFIAAKLVGVWPEEFGIGLPPRVWGKKIGETLWSINALPLGGFVRLHGEVGEAVVSQPKRAFTNASKLSRAFIAAAGVTMNIIFAIVAFSIIFYVIGFQKGIKVEKVLPESPAFSAGLSEGDVITNLDGQELYNTSFFLQTIQDIKGRDTKVTFKDKDGNVKTNSFHMKDVDKFGVGYTITTDEIYQPKGFTRFLESIKYGTKETFDFSKIILRAFSRMVKQLTSGRVPSGLTGPVGVVGITAEVAKRGPLDLLNLAAIISVNLAIINLVPFPPLDGSRILFLFVEMIVGRKKLPKYEEKIHTWGMYILLTLMLLLTIREIPKLLTSSSLNGFVEKLVK